MTTYPDQPDHAEEPAWWELDVRLGDAPPDVLAAIWTGGPDLSRLLWCTNCCRVFPAAHIWLTNASCWCPDCEACASCLYWWDQWPRLVLPAWTENPTEGTYYFLPACVYDSILKEAAGPDTTPYGYEEDPLRFLTPPPEGHTH